LILNAVVVEIEGAGYRLRKHANLVPERIRAKALIDPATATTPRRTSRPSAQGCGRHHKHRLTSPIE
jgi:hypothetical protein